MSAQVSMQSLKTLANYASNVATEANATASLASNMATVASNMASLASNAVAASRNFLAPECNLVDLTNAAAARSNLGLGPSNSVAFSNVQLAGNLTPAQTQTQSIGTSNLRFATAWIDELHLSQNTLYVGGVPVLGTSDDTIQVKADPDQSISIKTLGLGRTILASEADVELVASGLSRKVLLQASGSNGRVNCSATREVVFDAPLTTVNGNTAMSGSLNVGALTVRGDATFNGSNFITTAETVEVRDNILHINRGQTGTGVSAGQAGLRVDRGDGLPYLIVFDESSQSFQVGPQGQLEAVASRPWVAQNGLTKSSNLSDLASAASARSALGLGATCNVAFAALSVSNLTTSNLIATSYAGLVNDTSSTSSMIPASGNAVRLVNDAVLAAADTAQWASNRSRYAANSNDAPSAPGYTWLGDLSTGMYHAGPGQVSLSASNGVGINTATPLYALDVNGVTRVGSNLIVGRGSNGTDGGIIQFAGTTGDETLNHAFISTRLFAAPEASEFLIFKGNDTRSNATNSNVLGSNVGPDRIRLRAGQIAFDTYPTGLTDLSTQATESNIRMVINENGRVGIATMNPIYPLDVAGIVRSAQFVCGFPNNTPGAGQEGGALLFSGVNGDLDYGSAYMVQRIIQNTQSELVVFKGYNATDCNNAGPDRIRLRAANIVFDTYPTDSSSYSNENIRMTVSERGFVGVGTGRPAVTLHLTNPDSNLSLSNNMCLSTEEAGYTYIGFNGFYSQSNAADVRVNSGKSRFRVFHDARASKDHFGIDVGTASNTFRPFLVNSNGNVLINAPLDSNNAFPAPLAVNGAVWAGSYMATASGTAGTPAFGFCNDASTGLYMPGSNQLGLATGGALRVLVDSNGFVGIGTDVPAYPLDVTGQIRATLGVVQTSDARIKTDIQKIRGGLDKVAQLHGYTYLRADQPSEPRQTGVIAQEVLTVLPEAVYRDGSGQLGVTYGNMAGLFIEAIKELKERLEALEKKASW